MKISELQRPLKSVLSSSKQPSNVKGLSAEQIAAVAFLAIDLVVLFPMKKCWPKNNLMGKNSSIFSVVKLRKTKVVKILLRITKLKRGSVIPTNVLTASMQTLAVQPHYPPAPYLI